MSFPLGIHTSGNTETMTSSYYTTSLVRSSNKCPQQQSVNDDQLDLNTLSPTNLRLENNEMESMLADLSPSSFSSIDDETVHGFGVNTTSLKHPTFNVQKDVPPCKGHQFYTQLIKS